MNYKEKIESKYNALVQLYPERTKESNMILALSKRMPEFLESIKKEIEPLEAIEEVEKTLAKGLDSIVEALENSSKERDLDLGIKSGYTYLLKYHTNLVQLGSVYSKYNEYFPELLSYLETIEEQ